MLKTFSQTDKGKKRMTNQDFVFTSEEPVGNLPNLFILADGMGGYNGGGYASSYTAEVMTKEISEMPDTTPKIIFEKAITRANFEIRKKALESIELDRMGTTVVACTIFGDIMHVTNVGDSRLYIVGDDIRQVTVDHSYVEEMIKVGSLDRESARNHPKKNIITRAVGADDEIYPDFFTVRLKPSEKVLLCSDGLSNMIEDDEILKICKSERDLPGLVSRLVETANNNGGLDNVSVIVINPFGD